MQNPRLAARYAKSLIDLAVEKGILEDAYNDMQLIDSVCKSSRELEVMFQSPVVKADKKMAIINEVFKANIHEVTHLFLHLLVNKGREENIPEIAKAFIEQYYAMKHIRTVKLTTATTLDKEMQNVIVAQINKYMTGHTVQMSTVVNDELIGGFVVETEDKLFDASVRKKLNDLRAGVVDTSYISKM